MPKISRNKKIRVDDEKERVMGVYIKSITIEQLRRMGVAGIILSESRLVEVPQAERGK